MKQFLFGLLVVGIIGNTISGFMPEKKLDLEALAKDKNAVWNAVRYRPTSKMDYTYCNTANELVDYFVEEVKGKTRLVAVCLALEQYYPRTLERNKYYKYNWVTDTGKVQFCGWRDNHFKLKKDGSIYWNDSDVGMSGKCDGFYIYKYNNQ